MLTTLLWFLLIWALTSAVSLVVLGALLIDDRRSVGSQARLARTEPLPAS